MRFLKAALLTVLLIKVVLSKNTLKKAMESEGFVPEIFDQAPSALITVKYNGKEIDFGQELTPLSVKEQPEVTWEADPNKFYLLAMIDPDAPSKANPIYREVKHWLVGNIPGNKVSEGDTIAEYVGSGPPKDTGLHSYIFLVFEQKDKIAYDEPKSSQFDRTHRLKFSIRNFSKKWGLGAPQFGNYYKAQWDEWVEERKKLHELHEQQKKN